MYGAAVTQMAQAGLRRTRRRQRRSPSVSREAFAGTRESSVMLGVLEEFS